MLHTEHLSFPHLLLTIEFLFQIFPNPTKGIVNIYTDLPHIAQLKIMDIQGQQVMEREINGNEVIDIQSLPAGYYTIQLNWDGKVSQRKLVKVD